MGISKISAEKGGYTAKEEIPFFPDKLLSSLAVGGWETAIFDLH